MELAGDDGDSKGDSHSILGGFHTAATCPPAGNVTVATYGAACPCSERLLAVCCVCAAVTFPSVGDTETDGLVVMDSMKEHAGKTYPKKVWRQVSE
jgi:hypothetical protein